MTRVRTTALPTLSGELSRPSAQKGLSLLRSPGTPNRREWPRRECLGQFPPRGRLPRGRKCGHRRCNGTSSFSTLKTPSCLESTPRIHALTQQHVSWRRRQPPRSIASWPLCGERSDSPAMLRSTTVEYRRSSHAGTRRADRFVDDAMIDSILSYLWTAFRPVVRFAYVTGMAGPEDKRTT